MVRFLFISGLISMLFINSYGQDFSNLKDSKPFDYGGSLNINQNSNFRQSGQFTPYSLFISGNANISFYGIALPFSFSYSNKKINYSQPFNFNQFGMQPSYKWVKAYIGYNSMSFSPYSLNGHQFMGGGLELAPPDFGIKFSAMYGRLIKKVEWDSLNIVQKPYYERLGFAVKIGYNVKGASVELGIFKAWDKKNSLSGLPDSLGLQPKENMVYSLSFNKTFLSKIKFSGEFAANSLTNDTRQSYVNAVGGKSLFFLMKPNGTTCYSKAIKGNIDYLAGSYTVGVAYERVDPSYATLGAYYFNNDFENITLTFTNQLLQGKINFSGSIGTQHNNLDKSKISSSQNFLGTISVTYIPSERVNYSANYSNQSYYTYMRTPFDKINSTTPYQNIDTLNFSQVSQSAMFNSSIVLGSTQDKDKRKMININLSYQQAVNKQSGNQQLSNSSNYQGTLMYSYSIVPLNLLLTGSFIGNYNRISSTDDMLMYGPVIGVSKSFFNKKLTSNSSFAYNVSYRNQKFTGDVLSFRIGAGYTHQKSHRLNLSLCLVYRNSPIEIINKQTIDFNGTLSYTYTLSKD